MRARAGVPGETGGGTPHRARRARGRRASCSDWGRACDARRRLWDHNLANG